MGFDHVHSAVDDHSRLAYSEIHADERVATSAAFLAHAAAFFHRHGITRIERVLTDNAWACRKGLAWKNVLDDLGATGQLTRVHVILQQDAAHHGAEGAAVHETHGPDGDGHRALVGQREHVADQGERRGRQGGSGHAQQGA